MASSDIETPPNLGDILAGQGAINRSQLLKAQEKHRESGVSIGRALVMTGAINEKARIAALHMAFGFELFEPAKHQVDPAVAPTIPQAFAEKHRIFAIRKERNALIVVMEDPSDAVVIDAVKHQAKLELKPMIATAADLTALIQGKPLEIAPEAIAEAAKPGLARRLLGWFFFPVLAFGPVAGFFALLFLSDEFTTMLNQKMQSTFDAVIWFGLGWGTWTLIIFYINDVLFGKKEDE